VRKIKNPNGEDPNLHQIKREKIDPTVKEY
jgi:hypothetical protein